MISLIDDLFGVPSHSLLLPGIAGGCNTGHYTLSDLVEGSADRFP